MIASPAAQKGKPRFPLDHSRWPVLTYPTVTDGCCPRTRSFLRLLPPVLSLAVLIICAWAWHRSLRSSDYFYRLDPDSRSTVLKRGFASSGGAMLFGWLREPLGMSMMGAQDPDRRYRHEVHPRLEGAAASLLRVQPKEKVAALGFGVSRGEIVINIPMAFLLPSSTYGVTYVPYYFIMLLAAISPARLAWKWLRQYRGAATAAAPAADPAADPRGRPEPFAA